MPTRSFKLAPLPMLVCAIWAQASIAAPERPVLMPAEIRPVDIQSSWGGQMATRRVLLYVEPAPLAIASALPTSQAANPTSFNSEIPVPAKLDTRGQDKHLPQVGEHTWERATDAKTPLVVNRAEGSRISANKAIEAKRGDVGEGARPTGHIVRDATTTVAAASSTAGKNPLSGHGSGMTTNAGDTRAAGTTTSMAADRRPLLASAAPASTTVAAAAPPANSDGAQARLAIERGPRPSAQPVIAAGPIAPSNNRPRTQTNTGGAGAAGVTEPVAPATSPVLTSVTAKGTRESTREMEPSPTTPGAYPALNARSPLPVPAISASYVSGSNSKQAPVEPGTRNAAAEVTAPAAATERATLVASAAPTSTMPAAGTARSGGTSHAALATHDRLAPSAASTKASSTSESPMETVSRNAEAPFSKPPAASDRATMLASAAATSAMTATGSASTRDKDPAELPVKVSIAPKLSIASVAPATSLRAVRSLLEMRRENVIMQEWDLSCGAAALTTLLRYQHGEPVTEKEVALTMMNRPEYLQRPELVQIREGFSLLDLKRYVDSRGFVGVATGKMELKDLIARAPIMVPINVLGYNHFVVFRGMRHNRVLLADPAWGNRTMPVNDFLDAWIDFPNIGHVGFVVKARPNIDPAPNLLAPRDIDFLTFG